MAVVYPRRAIWDLAHAAGLSTAPSLILIVSEYTSYILQNLAGADVWDHWRWALAPPEYGIYSPVKEGSSEWSLVQEAAEAFQTEMVEVGTVPIYGIVDTVGDVDSYAVPGAGAYERSFEVPEDEMWELQLAEAIVSSGTAAALGLKVVSSETPVNLEIFTSLTSGGSNRWSGRVVLSPGQLVTFDYSGVTAGATLISRVWFARLMV
jgi:hypothetical protein